MTFDNKKLIHSSWYKNQKREKNISKKSLKQQIKRHTLYFVLYTNQSKRSISSHYFKEISPFYLNSPQKALVKVNCDSIAVVIVEAPLGEGGM